VSGAPIVAGRAERREAEWSKAEQSGAEQGHGTGRRGLERRPDSGQTRMAGPSVAAGRTWF